jgi:hypothetical protein
MGIQMDNPLSSQVVRNGEMEAIVEIGNGEEDMDPPTRK